MVNFKRFLVCAYLNVISMKRIAKVELLLNLMVSNYKHYPNAPPRYQIYDRLIGIDNSDNVGLNNLNTKEIPI